MTTPESSENRETVGSGTAESVAATTELREQFRAVIEAANALAQAIFLCDDMSEKQSNNHPEGNDFVTHYVIPHGLWAQVLREKQNLRHAIQTTLLPRPTEAGEVVVVSGDVRGESALRYLPDDEQEGT